MRAAIWLYIVAITALIGSMFLPPMSGWGIFLVGVGGLCAVLGIGRSVAWALDQHDRAKAAELRAVRARGVASYESRRAQNLVCAVDSAQRRQREAETTARTVAAEHAATIRPTTAGNVSRKWLKRREQMAASVAAIYAARAAQEGKS